MARAIDRHPPPGGSLGLEDIEVVLLLEGVYRRYGFDFRQFAPSSLRRRILDRVREEKVRSVSGLQEALLHDAAVFERFVTAITLGAAGFFLHPQSDRGFRDLVAPGLRRKRRPRVWHLGCSTGADLYSTAVLLREEGLAGQSRVYATELHEAPLRAAARGEFPLPALRAAESRYRAAGGERRLADYYRVSGAKGVFRPELRRNVLFASHNYMTDSSFNEFDLVVCRDLLPELRPDLQDRVHRLLLESLAPGGYLLLGPSEADATFSTYGASYEPLDPDRGLYRRRP